MTTTLLAVILNTDMHTAQLGKIVARKESGFTLIELLIVIGILAVLMGIVLIAINPARQFSQANNTKRQSDTSEILNAIGQYEADHKGALPTGLTSAGQAATEIANTGSDICGSLIPTYIASLPVDPLLNGGTPISACGTGVVYDTGYKVAVSGTNSRVTVSAPSSELGVTISVTR